MAGYRSLKVRPDYDRIFADAIAEAGPDGVDSIRLLVAALDNANVAQLIIRAGGDPSIIRAAARRSHSTVGPEQGLTSDAKAVVEKCASWALTSGLSPDAEDLLIGLAAVQCRARLVLNANGIGEDRARACRTPRG
jgi:hypothetical protein